MTEQAAKLTVKVKLHAAQPVVLPTTVAPARLSKMKVTLGLLLLVLLTAAGYLLWQQFVGKVPSAVAADDPQLNRLAVPQDLVPPAVTNEPEIAVETIAASAQANENTGAEVVTVTSEPATPAPQPAIQQSTQQSTQQSSQQISQQSTQQTTQQIAAPATTAIVSSRNLPEGFSRIVLAATMEQLEPGAAIDKLVAQQDIQRLYLFTELKGYAGQQLIHRWSFAGKVQTEALLTIEDSPWRTYSEKWLLPDQLGSWRVEIVDQQQNVLYQHDFQYQ